MCTILFFFFSYCLPIINPSLQPFSIIFLSNDFFFPFDWGPPQGSLLLYVKGVNFHYTFHTWDETTLPRWRSNQTVKPCNQGKWNTFQKRDIRCRTDKCDVYPGVEQPKPFLEKLLYSLSWAPKWWRLTRSWSGFSKERTQVNVSISQLIIHNPKVSCWLGCSEMGSTPPPTSLLIKCLYSQRYFLKSISHAHIRFQ